MSRPAILTVDPQNGSPITLPPPPAGGCLADHLAGHGLPLNTRCGGRGLCHGCEIELTGGSLEHDGQPVAAPATVKACRCHAAGAASIQIPVRSRLEHRPQVGDTFSTTAPFDLTPPFNITPGTRDTGFAIDIGTTTVVAMLVDLVTGETLARAGAFNAQIRFGDNVLTRIEAAADPAVLLEMRRAIIGETVAPLLRRACQRAGIPPARIAGGTIAGNTTMLHLLTGSDPTPLGVAPFTPRFIKGLTLRAADLDPTIPDLPADTPVLLLPGIAAYIGADITAGIHASGMIYDPAPSLLVDIGTNGEIVLQNNGKLTACATAAGPAFEGSGLRCGTRARDGAVSDLAISLAPFDPGAGVIGGAPVSQATGICGSAYIDFLATARAAGLLGPAGRFAPAAWDNLPEANRLCDENGKALVLHQATKLEIAEIDVALLLQAKAAIGAGIETLLDQAGIQAAQLTKVYLAGGFGMHLNLQNAIDIGLLPGIRAEQIEIVGNSSLAGALVALLDRAALPAMETLRQQTRIIELNSIEDFEDRYIDHLSLP